MEATIYLNEIPSEMWTLSKCPQNRFGHLTFNISESFNSWLFAEHLVEPFETIHSLQLQSIINRYQNRMVYQVDVSIFEVKSDNSNFHIVDLALLTCTCRQFQEYQFPFYPIDTEMCLPDNRTLPPAAIKQAEHP
ncbi:7717_t:CDS:2 [Gigaspora margarita]|uniref:7717_t:CDS:1 n=1 Tax=Gigaspora margarita TaxID=4874 RepID=A0ABN7V9Y4_GIGMA|nr:7717_t:CDS:2 [Gigaspora margarita]